MRSKVLCALATTALLTFLAGCGSASSSQPGSGSGVIKVVAAENFWGSIAAQLGGRQVKVTNIINSPDADPHDYEATALDGRAIASADLVLINGIGYDGWATKLAAANPDPNRTVLTVGDLVGVPAGGNPHRWYNPGDVSTVINAIVADYRRLDPADAGYLDQQRTAFETTALARYTATIAEIKAKYAGTPVGASESIFAMLAPALGLRLITPPAFLKAISEGTDPTAADRSTIDAQITGKKIKVYVYNSQNATPDVQAQIAEAKAAGIPVSTITETLTPGHRARCQQVRREGQRGDQETDRQVATVGNGQRRPGDPDGETDSDQGTPGRRRGELLRGCRGHHQQGEDQQGSGDQADLGGGNREQDQEDHRQSPDRDPAGGRDLRVDRREQQWPAQPGQ